MVCKVREQGQARCDGQSLPIAIGLALTSSIQAAIAVKPTIVITSPGADAAAL